jgi:hypothetical protein
LCMGIVSPTMGTLSVRLCGLGRYTCGKTTGCESPTEVKAFGVGLD